MRLVSQFEEHVPAAAKECAKKLASPAKSSPQALKRGTIFSHLAARVELVPFPNGLEPEFFPWHFWSGGDADLSGYPDRGVCLGLDQGSAGVGVRAATTKAFNHKDR